MDFRLTSLYLLLSIIFQNESDMKANLNCLGFHLNWFSWELNQNPKRPHPISQYLYRIPLMKFTPQLWYPPQCERIVVSLLRFFFFMRKFFFSIKIGKNLNKISFLRFYTSRKSNGRLLELRITITLQWQPIYRHPLWL